MTNGTTAQAPTLNICARMINMNTNVNVWNTNIKVAELQNDLGDAEQVISVLEKKIASSDDNAKNIIGIEKDIEYMKGSLGRIEQLVTSK